MCKVQAYLNLRLIGFLIVYATFVSLTQTVLMSSPHHSSTDKSFY